MDNEEFFAHHGVKGMRWGVRKTPTRKEQAARNKRASAAKNRRTIPDADLDAYIKRIQSERKLKELVSEDLSPGRAFAKKVVGETGKKAISTVAAGATIYVVKALVESGGNPIGALSILKRDKKSFADSVYRGGKPKK